MFHRCCNCIKCYRILLLTPSIALFILNNDALYMSNKEKVDKFLVEICQLILAPPVGLEPTTAGLTVRCSTDWAKEECLCWQYLSSRQVTLQVLSAQMSLTSVFGMGTGGPSSQSLPTRLDGIEAIVYVKSFAALNSFILPLLFVAVNSSFPNQNAFFGMYEEWWPVPDSNRC